jgi:hypothetical protein
MVAVLVVGAVVGTVGVGVLFVPPSLSPSPSTNATVTREISRAARLSAPDAVRMPSQRTRVPPARIDTNARHANGHTSVRIAALQDHVPRSARRATGGEDGLRAIQPHSWVGCSGHAMVPEHTGSPSTSSAHMVGVAARRPGAHRLARSSSRVARAVNPCRSSPMENARGKDVVMFGALPAAQCLRAGLVGGVVVRQRPRPLSAGHTGIVGCRRVGVSGRPTRRSA